MKRKDTSIKDLHLLVNEEQHRAIKIASAQTGHSMSEYCLAQIFNGKVEARLQPNELKVLRELASLGNNTNQIARKLNQLNADKLTIALAEDAIQKIHSMLSKLK